MATNPLAVAFFTVGVLISNFIADVLSISSHYDVELKCLSWNVNGVSKFSSLLPELRFLEEFDAVFLQETFTTSPENGFNLAGFIPYHAMGRVTGGCPSWGLTTLLRIDTFVGGTMKPLQSPLDWLQVTRWRSPSDRGILFVNIYVAVHTRGFDATDTSTALDFLASLRADYPADNLLMGGDFNADPWRLLEQRSAGQQISHKARYLIQVPPFPV